MRQLLLYTILLFMPLSMWSQHIDGGLSCSGQMRVSERWSIGGNVGVNISDAKSNGLWETMSVGGIFQVLDSLCVYALGTTSHEEFFDIENSDHIWKLSEGLRWDMPRFSHDFCFDQRKLHFMPSDYYISCSRVSYQISHLMPFKKHSAWALDWHAQIVCNITSDVSNSSFVQRVKLGCILSRQISSSTSLGIKYGYMLGGRRQTYMGEAHNMHRISMFFSIKK